MKVSVLDQKKAACEYLHRNEVAFFKHIMGSELSTDPEIINIVSCRVAGKKLTICRISGFVFKVNAYGMDDHSFY